MTYILGALITQQHCSRLIISMACYGRSGKNRLDDAIKGFSIKKAKNWNIRPISPRMSVIAYSLILHRFVTNLYLLKLEVKV